jgi:hypothetical protein
MSTLFRLRYEELGGHTHVRVFAGNNEAALGKCGNLVFQNHEWSNLLGLLATDLNNSFGRISIKREDE